MKHETDKIRQPGCLSRILCCFSDFFLKNPWVNSLTRSVDLTAVSALLYSSISKCLPAANPALKTYYLILLFFPLPYKFWLNFRVKTVYPALLKWISLQVVSTCQIFTLLICLFQLEFSVLCTYKYLLYCHHLTVGMWFLCNLKKKPFWVCCRITPTLKKQLTSPET